MQAEGFRETRRLPVPHLTSRNENARVPGRQLPDVKDGKGGRYTFAAEPPYSI